MNGGTGGLAMRREGRRTRGISPEISRAGLGIVTLAAGSRGKAAALVLVLALSLVFAVPQAYAAVAAETQFILDKTVGARIPPAHEELGQDAAELGIESYPEFVLMPELDD